jgi:hypothetical protein
MAACRVVLHPDRREFGADLIHPLAASPGDKRGRYRYAPVAEALDQPVGPFPVGPTS